MITDENWLKYTGNLQLVGSICLLFHSFFNSLRPAFDSAYSAFVAYFSEQVRTKGVTATLEHFIFEPTLINGATMLIRFVSGA